MFHATYLRRDVVNCWNCFPNTCFMQHVSGGQMFLCHFLSIPLPSRYFVTVGPKCPFPWNRILCIFQLQSTVGQQALQKCTLMTEAMKESYNVVYHHSDRKRHERQQRQEFNWSPYHCYKANSCLLYRWHALYKANFNLNLQHPNPSTQTSASHAELTLTSIAQFLCKSKPNRCSTVFLGLAQMYYQKSGSHACGVYPQISTSWINM